MKQIRNCQQCGRKLFPNEGDVCRLCIMDYEMQCIAHEALYGREEREMAEQREEEYERDKDEPDYEPYPDQL